jgi:hypothetical protein
MLIDDIRWRGIENLLLSRDMHTQFPQNVESQGRPPIAMWRRS